MLWRAEESRQEGQTVDLSGRGQGRLGMDVVVMAYSACDVMGRREVVVVVGVTGQSGGSCSVCCNRTMTIGDGIGRQSVAWSGR